MNGPLWTDERGVPDVLLNLLGVSGLPEDLRKEILQAVSEVEERGVVTYPTKARVEYYLHHHHDCVLKLVENLDNRRP